MIDKTGNILRSRITGGLFFAMAAGLGLNADVQAQANAQSASGLEEIVVTARRREEQLQDVPISLTAHSGLQLETRAVTNVTDLQMVSPGLFVFPGATRGNASPVFSIRGQANRDPQVSSDPSIGIYFAEMPWARSEGANADMFDIAQVQVLKGPQGTLFGRNSTGGAILITPQAPTYEFDGYLKASAGNYNLRGGEAMINFPVVDGKWALRLGGQYKTRDGYMVMLNTGNKLSDVDNHSVRVSLLWTPTEDFKSTSIYSYFQADVIGEGAKLVDIAPQAIAGQAAVYPLAQQYLALNQQAGKYEGYSVYDPNTVTFVAGPRPVPTEQVADVETHSIQNMSEWNIGETGVLGDVTLKNIVGFRMVDRLHNYDNINMPVLTVLSASGTEVHQISEEFQISGTSGNLDYMTGVFYMRETTPDVWAHTMRLGTLIDRQQGPVKNLAKSAFLSIHYDLSELMLEGLSLNAGGRITKDSRYITNQNIRENLNGTWQCRMTGLILPTNRPGACSVESSVITTEPTWTVGLDYRFTSDNMIYGSVSHGYRTGGVQQGATSAASATPFLPEFVDNYEVGSKNDFNFGDMPGRFNVTAFYSDYKDMQRQVNTLVGTNFLSLRFNAAKGDIKGLEAEFTIQPTPDLELSANYAYLDTNYDEYFDYVVGAGGVRYPVDISDSWFGYVSDHSVSFNARYILPLDTRYGELSVNGSYWYRTEFTTNTDVFTENCSSAEDPNVPPALYSQCWNRIAVIDGYGLVNANVNWTNVMGSGINANFFVTNLTNKYYYMYTLASVQNLTTLSNFPGAPRMFGLNISIPFGASAHD